MDSYEKRIQMQKEKKLMEWLASTKSKSNGEINKNQNSKSKNTIFEIRRELIEYRKTKAKEKNIPPCYVFTNEELDKLLMIKPKTYSDLSGAMILPDIKLKLHGKEILKIFNEKNSL